MAVFLVSYDLRKPTRDYQPLYDRLKAWKAIRPLESVWIINWDTSAAKIRDDLKAHIDANDGLLVTKLAAEAAWSTLDRDTGPALKQWLEA